MPIYEYVCEKCGNHLEMLQKVGDAPPKKCSKCKKGRMEKIFSRTSFQLKGGGWYATDYAKPAATGKAETKAESKTENKAESKTESKAEKKPDSKTDKTSTDTKTATAV
ncbi:MAG: zinc ribbon domain-containing protein [Acidobacteria bacterium]|nr:zinc ribbon domain-containing protein [Acidobacteriota bacterium]